jgi:rfaE bifunctional protein nucleotidyltransferase chain/domain/rfaE bifunctional protein kinase chain/domain
MAHDIVVVGDLLLDRDIHGSVDRIAPDAPAPVFAEKDTALRPGGAGLAAVLAARDGDRVTLVAAVADDEAGNTVRELLAAYGVDLVALPLDGTTPEKIRFCARDQILMRLDRGNATGIVGEPSAPVREAIAAADGILVSDYGRGVVAQPSIRAALTRAARRTPLVWDPHPHGTAPVAGARLMTPNEREVAGATADDRIAGARLRTVADAADAVRDAYGLTAVAVTLGSDGALLVQTQSPPLLIPAPERGTGDPCGAGDRFASTVAQALAAGALPFEAVQSAVAAATAFVTAGGLRGGALDRWPKTGSQGDGGRAAVANRRCVVGEAAVTGLIHAVHDRGGTVIATGGCFDLMHAGHVSMLEAARALGDALIVCLNSDASVQALKGPGRPLNAQDDRVTMMRALACVSGVVVFDGPTPIPMLERLRPDVWVKGADYLINATDDGPALPEAATIRSWGGQTVVVPYLSDHSTTKLIRSVLARSGGPSTASAGNRFGSVPGAPPAGRTIPTFEETRHDR